MLFGVAQSWGQAGAGHGGDETTPPRLNSAEMMQREIDRRREVTFRLNEILDLADRLYRSGEWQHAEAKYNLVLLETDPQAQTGGFHKRAQLGKARCLTAQSLAKEEEGKLGEAAGLLKQAAELDPTNKALARKVADLQEEGSRLSDPYQGNPAVTEELLQKTAEIKRLLSLADQLTETGQYREARKRLDDVLRLDPYNRVARKKIEVLEEKRLVAADQRYLASREKALAKVSEAWLPPPPAKVEPGKGRKTGAAGDSNAAEILKKLAKIRIPELTFNERPIRAAVEELQRLSEQYDPEKEGLNFVLRLPPPGEGTDPESATVSLELRDISLQTALKYLCEQIRGGEKLRAEVEDNAVFLLPATETGGELEIRSYNLPPSLIANLDKASNDPTILGEDILKNIGVNVAVEGASAVCFRDTGKMVVRNTPGELNKIEQRIRDAQGERAQKQFEVETKFLQFSDNDVKNFTFNLQMATGSTVYGTGAPGAVFVPSSTGGTDGLRGTAGLNQNGVSVVALQSLLDPTFPQDASNQIGVNAQVLGRGVSALLQLLQNAIGKDLVAAPRVTLADGKPSEIVISRQMFYPTSYTQPTVPNNDQGVGAGFILPSNPTGFESRNIGVTLTVKGESTSIPKAVDLDFTKLEVEDFEGFVNYGATIATVTQGQGGSLQPGVPTQVPTTQQIGQSPYLVPIFSKRSLQSRVRLLDGETVGLGGLISESVQLVDDKVPGLGDMPLVGRLFRSEASQKIKFNLVIFCTVRIIEPDGSLSFPEDEENPEYAQAGSAEMMPSVP
jgi:general secretion pathway protein D